MGKSIQALITPEVLAWARNLDRISVEEASHRVNVSDAKIEEWESGISRPTLRQAKEFAKFYRVPFVYLYLPYVPQRIKRIEKVDYRTFGNVGDSFIQSRELRWFLRDVDERRDIMFELYKLEEKEPKPFEYRFPIETDPGVIAVFIRELLNLNDDIQVKFRKPEAMLTYCINKLEDLDVLVFQAAKIEPNEMRGLSLGYEVFPIIALNRKDEASARLFTLIHELAHILFGTSGLCNDTSENSTTTNQMELLCNKIAGPVLVPEQSLNKHPAIKSIKKYGFDDVFVTEIARDFAVSKEVIIHHLWSIGVISRKMYFETLQRYSDEYLSYKAKKKKGFLPPALDKGTQVGKLYAKTVLSTYYGDKISARDASGYLLNLGTQHFEKVERWCY